MRNGMKNVIGFVLFVSLTTLSFITYARGDFQNLSKAEIDADIQREYYLKGAFLRYVSRMVTWPKTNDLEFDINVCVLGEVGSKKGMNSLNGRVAEGKILNVRYIRDHKVALEPKACQILLVAKSEKKNYATIIEDMKNQPVLSFGDGNGFAELGGNMNFYIMNNRLAIMINMEAMSDAGFLLSPRMLKIVTIIPRAEDLREGENSKPKKRPTKPLKESRQDNTEEKIYADFRPYISLSD